MSEPGRSQAAQGEPAAHEDLQERLLSRLRGAAQALPPSVAPTSVRAIRSAHLMRALSEAMAPERQRYEDELARARQRAAELEALLGCARAERKDVDETRRVELPRLAALVDQERTRAEELERERAEFVARVAELEADLARRESQAQALEAALPPVEAPDAAGEADALARVQERLERIAAGISVRPGASDPPPGGPDVAETPRTGAPDRRQAEESWASRPAVGGDPTDDDRLVQALLSSEARALRIAALEQRVAAITGESATLPGADEPPAARAVVALLRAHQEEAQVRATRLEGRVEELLEVTRDLHGALVEERRRRSLVEGALRAVQARLAVAERREPTRLPSFARVIKGDVGPLLDAVREEALRRDEALEGRIQRLSLATRAALERMAEILDQALVAGLFDRSTPRLDPEALSAPILEALGAAPARSRPDRRRAALDALGAADSEDDLEVDELGDDELGDDELGDDELGDDELGDDGVDGDELGDDEAGDLPDHEVDDEPGAHELDEPLVEGLGGPGDDEPSGARRTLLNDEQEAWRAAMEPAAGPEAPDLGVRGGAPAGRVAPERERPAATAVSRFMASRHDDDEWSDLASADGPAPDVHVSFVEELEDEGDEQASSAELATWFRPGRPGQSDSEREAEQLARYQLDPPSAELVSSPSGAETSAPSAVIDTGDRGAEGDLGGLEGLDDAQADALGSAVALEAERRRLEDRVRDAERALESEVWRGLATHRELVTTRQRLESLEARLTGEASHELGAPPASGQPTSSGPGGERTPDESAPTLGGLEAIAELGPLRDEAVLRTAERTAVLSLEVDDRDSWVHWLLLEHDPQFRDARARAARQCADAVRRPTELSSDEPRREELLHWLETEPPAPGPD